MSVESINLSGVEGLYRQASTYEDAATDRVADFGKVRDDVV